MIEFLVLFSSAFGAATILPFFSEIALVAMVEGGFNLWMVWLVATVGNSLGAAVNWVLGLYIEKFQHRRWFPFSEKDMDRGHRWFNRYGKWSLILAWLPFGGDAITLIAGVFRVDWWSFILITTTGKGLRYAAVIGIYTGFWG